MSLHRSLKTQPAALNLHRNVLTRAERIEWLAEKGRFSREDDSPLGLVKVANRKVVTKKKKKDDDETATAAEGEVAAEAKS